MIRRLILALPLLAPLALAACTQAQLQGPLQFSTADVTTAQALANSPGAAASAAANAIDPVGAQCWGSMLPSVQALEGGKAVGLATATEIYRVAMIQIKGPCVAIALPILAKLSPIPGFSLAISQLPGL